MATTIPGFTPDLFSDEVLADPYEHYRALREPGAVVWLEARQMYVLPRHENVRAAERDPGTFCSGRGVGLNDLINEAGAGTTLMSDGERHQAQRGLLFGPLTPKALVSDLINAYAELPLTVTAGAPPQPLSAAAVSDLEQYRAAEIAEVG